MVGGVADSPLIAAIIGGVFLLINSIINIFLVKMFGREEREAILASTKNRKTRPVHSHKASGRHPNHSSRGRAGDLGDGGKDANG